MGEHLMGHTNLALSNPAAQPEEPKGGSVLRLQIDLITTCKIILTKQKPAP